MATTISQCDGDVFRIVVSEANRQVGSTYQFDTYAGEIISWYNREFIFRFVEIHAMAQGDNGPEHVAFPDAHHGDVWYEACIWMQDGDAEPFDEGGEDTRRYTRIHTFDVADVLPNL